jgi:CTP synthase
MAKYIFVTGGVVSSLGKGIAAASLGTLLKYQGINVNLIKLDPYVNVDPGTMSPFQHGEVFVTEDGSETDLDLGHYERFVDIKMGKRNNFTTGLVYQKVIEKERRGEYLGQTVQIVPHIVDEIKRCITQDADQYDVTIVEVGGVVGDIESLPFLEAIRQLGIEQPDDVLFAHLTLVPYLKAADEVKTKPTQHSVKELRSIGIQPDILLCRCEKDLTDDERRKISLFTNVHAAHVIQLKDSYSIYMVPIALKEEDLDYTVINELELEAKEDRFDEWVQMVLKADDLDNDHVRIAVVGKYAGLRDSYKSIAEALTHAGMHLGADITIRYIKTEELTEDHLEGVDGILVPGGFGERGMASKNFAIQYAREKKIPFLGICLGMQLAVIEFARNIAGLAGADSTEANPDAEHPVVTLMPEWNADEGFGGTLRLGGQECRFVPNTNLHDAYLCYGHKPFCGTAIERHRHRYEFNNVYRAQLEDAGMVFSAESDGKVEAIELANHPFFVATQFHPEFSSNPRRGHPVFLGFIEAAKEYYSPDETE